MFSFIFDLAAFIFDLAMVVFDHSIQVYYFFQSIIIMIFMYLKSLFGAKIPCDEIKISSAKEPIRHIDFSVNAGKFRFPIKHCGRRASYFYALRDGMKQVNAPENVRPVYAARCVFHTIPDVHGCNDKLTKEEYLVTEIMES